MSVFWQNENWSRTEIRVHVYCSEKKISQSCVLLRRVSIICKNISHQIVRDTTNWRPSMSKARIEDLRNSLVFLKFIVFQFDKVVRSNFPTLVVQLTIFLFSLLLRKFIQRGLALIFLGKCGSPLIKVTLTELSVSNLRHAFTLN